MKFNFAAAGDRVFISVLQQKKINSHKMNGLISCFFVFCFITNKYTCTISINK